MTWNKSWLTQRTQCVVVDGISSSSVSVLSGVPQGTVLGPLLFLIYINDIASGVSSSIRLFADDCILYRTIKCEADSIILQRDLDILSQWSTLWQMKFNVSKCVLIRCSRSPNLFQYNYPLYDHILDFVLFWSMQHLCGIHISKMTPYPLKKYNEELHGGHYLIMVLSVV